MSTLGLSSSDVADTMCVDRQAVDEWLVAGPPEEWVGKLGVVSEIADILGDRLLSGLPSVAVRRPADAYDGRTMLDVIRDGEHVWLLQSVKESFDFGTLA